MKHTTHYNFQSIKNAVKNILGVVFLILIGLHLFELRTKNGTVTSIHFEPETITYKEGYSGELKSIPTKQVTGIYISGDRIGKHRRVYYIFLKGKNTDLNISLAINRASKQELEKLVTIIQKSGIKYSISEDLYNFSLNGGDPETIWFIRELYTLQ